MKEELSIIVNEQDEIIGYKSRNDIIAEDIYRVSALWIENSTGEVLMAQRGFMKRNGPGRWGTAAAGTVEKGETYEESIYRESEEEIGLRGYSFQKDIKLFRNKGDTRFFCQWYTLILDKNISEFVLEKPQVESIRWFSKEELRNILHHSPAVLVGKDFIEKRLS